MLSEQLDGIFNDHDQFKQAIIEQKQNPCKTSLIEQIDRWEQEAIKTIQLTAQECRETVIRYTRIFVDEMDGKLGQLTEQLRNIREENDFNDIDLQRLNKKLTEARYEFTDSSKIAIKEDSQALINKIYVLATMKSKWKQQATTVAGRNDSEDELNHLCYPFGISIDQNRNIFIADHNNHRVVEWKWQAKTGIVMIGGDEHEDKMDQLNQPTDVLVDRQNHSLIVADCGNRRVIRWCDQSETNQQILIDNIDSSGLTMDKDGFLYVSDYEKNEVRRWKDGETEGTLVAGGNGRGSHPDQFDGSDFLFVDDNQSIYVSDENNHRAMKWCKGAKVGVIVAGGNGQGIGLNQLSSPRGVLVDRWGQIYVADCRNHRIVRWREGEREGEVVAGGNGKGDGCNQLYYPTGLSFDDKGNLYVVDSGNDRVQNFDLIVD